MPQMKPFGKHDWDCFAGAEGNARIAEIKVEIDGKMMDGTIVSDDAGVGIMFDDPADDGDSEINLTFTASNSKYAAMLADSIPDVTDYGFLLEIGFVRLN